ncbi:hypothetical protein [Actinomadura miaoliensis]|uniref:Uncharacterized protein n=1 Tax=Actinomadura miaoliensis TaxID=430685 RepID=A0ABP7VAB0_9ACTN
MTADGTIERRGHRVTFRYERRLAHPAETALHWTGDDQHALQRRYAALIG